MVFYDDIFQILNDYIRGFNGEIAAPTHERQFVIDLSIKRFNR